MLLPPWFVPHLRYQHVLEDALNDPKAVNVWSKVEGIDALIELALNLHWPWNHAGDELWKRLDGTLWESTQNPLTILRTVSAEK
jgi:starch phosphorylase